MQSEPRHYPHTSWCSFFNFVSCGTGVLSPKIYFSKGG